MIALFFSSLSDPVLAKKKNKKKSNTKKDDEEKEIVHPKMSSYKKNVGVLPGSYCYACQSMIRNSLMSLRGSKDVYKVGKEMKSSCRREDYFDIDALER